MQTVLLAGGLGSRLSEETVRIPKPMVEVNGRPIMMHVMDIYSHFGQKDFVLACGYKCMTMKAFFNNLHLMNNDFTVTLGTGQMNLRPCRSMDWNVSVVDTGETTMTGGRIRRLRDWLGDEPFMVTYSDGVGNVDIDALLAFHRAHGRIATVTAVQPPARFGNLDLEDDRVARFTEKVTRYETWINGGFFVFEPGIFDYLGDDTEPLEQSPLARLAADGELFAYKHRGFWHPMDTIRDRDQLERLSAEGTPPWLQFENAHGAELRPKIYA
ncbi:MULTISPECIES: glucose-1-phosphate cytidylyltransferase [Sphingobium]|jgi:glucose-1-phosphate cytidylyltransferase|uniref:Glucose-1-phosphate cytidylyltransferase n=1 Tax=Sphingobium yanoikuyae TaxID=13690 RepID=A0A0J9FT33_SPHYA|nr:MULTISPECIES: glucose-1-phosphate cytidylyltransferase [Sphingobium]ATI81076.1 glucose-1-phosphate cytidylyltransferase [Sphingobium yanoikuyae]ATP20538.1 glucose-1-phosphate cytidylyltransferase [Sphingobium yanoikuyae]KMW31375.1 glucose-1-phosphate cytidylyltransferase [Sphingobium yanoikuyae]NBB39527.1 glucose-1-phosphate cytidylyltransferase [Sphingobium yanoikuyae]PZU70913.1 MAG: glucose-1-phosphate cytidylyltransferase [Sphingobium sp.]